MCRIVGIKSIKGKIEPKVLEKMRDTMSHGGPDAANVYINPEETVGLGHRRLSILDLSEAGNQPMYYKHWVVVFNGEIYNFMEVRQELEEMNIPFSTGTDTEMLIKAFEVWGHDCVKKFRGMFAFAIWDSNEEKLILCRDRVGVKPLYYYKKDHLFFFASELKAFHEHPDFDKTIDFEALSLYLQQGYIHSPLSIFKHVKKVEPGSFLTIDKDNGIVSKRYWEAEKKYGVEEINAPIEETTERLESILKESFQYRMVADVPVGMFLSGGIDSSLVTAVLQKQSNQQLKTFTIGFKDERFNEANHAKKVAQHIGTDHTELYCDVEDFKKIIPKFCEIYCEPFGDSSGIPTYLVSQLAKQSVKVSLSADGGDEIFGGYSKYKATKDIYSKLKGVPAPIKKIVAKALQPISPQTIEKYGSKLPYLKNFTNVGVKFHKAKSAIASDSLLAQFNAASTFLSQDALSEIFPVYKNRFETDASFTDKSILSFLGLVDIKTYLEGDIMTKVDRATMQVALEGREPFLDQNIIEFGLNLPDDYKYRDGKGKFILREILYKYVPKELIERPKQGFAIPIREWLLGLLSSDLRALASDSDFTLTFQLNQNSISQKIENFLTGKKYENEYNIWFLYVLYKWYQRWILN